MAKAESEQEGAADSANLVLAATKIVTAYIERNQIAAGDIPNALRSVLTALRELASGVASITSNTPAVPIKKSVFDDHIVCLEDGKKLTMLKRYLRTRYNMSADEYRKKWGLPADYPMVAPAYARLRSAFAKKIGLGKIPTTKSRTKRKP
jgi:predicted transcriptional regulator